MWMTPSRAGHRRSRDRAVGAEVAATSRAPSPRSARQRRRRVADDRDDVVASGAQEARDAAADEPGGAGDDDRRATIGTAEPGQ